MGQWLIDPDPRRAIIGRGPRWAGALDLCEGCGHACFTHVVWCCQCVSADSLCRICEARR